MEQMLLRPEEGQQTQTTHTLGASEQSCVCMDI